MTAGAVFSDPSAFTDDSGDKAHDDLFRFAYRRTSSRFPFSLLGLGLLLAGGFKTVERYHFLRTAQEAQGTVSALNAGGSHPQIDFTSVSGERISYPQGGFIFGYQVGEPVRVLYEAGRPAASAIVDDAGALWGNSAFLCGFGALFGIVGFRGLLGLRSSQPTSKGH